MCIIVIRIISNLAADFKWQNFPPAPKRSIRQVDVIHVYEMMRNSRMFL